ncbi:hypothetical protein EBR78_01355 [bacterium]|nr:hypothetical protein [bacterium]NBX82844.1 hypothetical protein [bacterium]
MKLHSVFGIVFFGTICFAHSEISTRYKTFSESSVRRCSIMKVRQPTFNICLAGQATGPDLERARTWAARASLTWLRALKVLDASVTRNILFTCEDKHLTINLRPGSGTSHASPSVTTIYLTRPYGTWTHELGHALAGLGDTYVAGSAGNCGSQPDSLMCWGAYGPRANPEEWSTLWQDDIQGIQYNFLKVLGNQSSSPQWAPSVDLEKSLNLNDPWPNSREEVFFEDHQVEVFEGPASEIDNSRSSESIDL